MTPDIIRDLVHTWEVATDSAQKNRALIALRDARREARAEIAAKRGWAVSKRRFGADQLRRGSWALLSSDKRAWELTEPRHPVCFVDAKGKPVAIVISLYGGFRQAAQTAAAKGLSTQLLLHCWYRPGSTNALLLTRREGGAA